MTDIEIARLAKKEPITEIAKKLNIEDKIELYGNDKAKINDTLISGEKKGKLVLVTAINPTPYGEGKTTVTIGLNDGLRKLNKNSLAVLREPSLGPVFGIKGGATGGGHSQVVPMEDINLHFTGDFHAITAANNLISAAIDNHLYFGNELNLDENNIIWKRTLDLNDRALREVTLKTRKDSFQITAACEIMSIVCLSKNIEDLKERINRIIIGFNKEGNPVYAKDLKVSGAVATILKDAMKPNLVQSLENNPIIMHCGPFANISNGCNSIIATNLGLKLADYVITEAGFGSDLGAEKFFDIKCRTANLKPDCVVIVATTKALKHNDIKGENNLERGLSNLEVHIENMLKFTKHVTVTLNKYETDTEEEINTIKDFVEKKGLTFSVNNAYSIGGEGAIELAQNVLEECNKENDFNLLYQQSLGIKDKIETVAKEIYHAKNIIYLDDVEDKIKEYEKLGWKEYPVCIAKTQYSISDDPKKLGYPKDYDITVRDIAVSNGAGFIVVYLGNIMTMPGLAKKSNYENIDIDNQGNITGIF